MRCKEHFQGDRCKKESGHEDLIHEGQFSSWRESADSKVKIMQSQKPIIKRHRGMDRLARWGGNAFRPRDAATRKIQADQLGQYAQYLRQSK